MNSSSAPDARASELTRSQSLIPPCMSQSVKITFQETAIDSEDSNEAINPTATSQIHQQQAQSTRYKSTTRRLKRSNSLPHYPYQLQHQSTALSNRSPNPRQRDVFPPAQRSDRNAFRSTRPSYGRAGQPITASFDDSSTNKLSTGPRTKRGWS